MTEAKSEAVRARWNGKKKVQPCWIAVPPTILCYNQTPCLTICDVALCKWLSERLEKTKTKEKTEDRVKNEDAKM